MRRLTATLLLLGACAQPSPQAPASTPSGADRMQWWREARFGLFVHWGLYAIPAGEWHGGTGHAEWIRETAHIPVAEYERFVAQWHPEHFDADSWASLAAEAGMKYVVLTSKHHDGFDLFDSKLSEFDVGSTQPPRDIVAEYAAACRRHGLRV